MLTSESSTRPWQDRLDWLLLVLLWGAAGLGLLISVIADGATTEAVVAASIVGVYVVAMQVTPRRFRHSDNYGELFAISGVIVSLVAVALTDGLASPYLLMLATPSFFAGATLGYRIGIETALLTTAGLTAVVALLDQSVLSGQLLQTVLLYLLIAVTFAQARRVLVAERVAASELNTVRQQRLAAAHSALVSLGELADAADLNPVTVGRAALRDLALLVPYEAGRVVLNDSEGPIVVARRGAPGEPGRRVEFPMRVGDRDLGRVDLWPGEGEKLTNSRAVIEELLRPVTLAYDNIALLRSIASRAVAEERARLARELHDDFGPSLASVGLSIDVALQEEGTSEELARQLRAMRRSVTGLIEEVRQAAADMRETPSHSLIEQANRIAGQVPVDGPAVLVDIDERRPPRATIAADLAAITGEAMRNALLHAGARSIRVEGFVDRSEGKLTVRDDGRGFDTTASHQGHFGLIGIVERAERIGATLDVDSAPGKGTRVTVSWGPSS